MKKQRIILLSLIIVALILLFLSTGGKRTDVFLSDYHLSEDGTKLEIGIGVSSSMGYVRNLRVKQEGDSQYVTFYSTFGLNSKLGAKNKFEMELNPACEKIYFYGENGDYRLVLQKISENEWEMSNQK